MNTLKQVWRKLAKSKRYREEFVAQQVSVAFLFKFARY